MLRTIIAILTFALAPGVAAAQSSSLATATPYVVQARPIGESVQIGVVLFSIGILLLISIPGLILIWRRMFRDEEPEQEQ